MILIITTAIICMTALEVLALSKGIDGALLWFVIGVLSTIVGWQGKKKQVAGQQEKFQNAVKEQVRKELKMSDKVNQIICAILKELEEEASKTQNPVDDIVVKFLKAICRCQ